LLCRIESLLLGLLSHLLTRDLLQGLDELLLVLQGRNAVLGFRGDQGFTGNAGVIDSRLQQVQHLDDLALGEVQGDALLLSHILELSHRESGQVGLWSGVLCGFLKSFGLLDDGLLLG